MEYRENGSQEPTLFLQKAGPFLKIIGPFQNINASFKKTSVQAIGFIYNSSI